MIGMMVETIVAGAHEWPPAWQAVDLKWEICLLGFSGEIACGCRVFYIRLYPLSCTSLISTQSLIRKYPCRFVVG